MRATDQIRRRWFGRKVVVFTAAWQLVALSAIGSGSALADGSLQRDLHIGSYLLDGTFDDGKFHPTPVSPGLATEFAIVIRNRDNQNLSHATLTLGQSPASPLPEGVSIAAVNGPDKSKCTIYSAAGAALSNPVPVNDTTGAAIVCNYGKLPAGRERTITVVVALASGFTGPDLPIDATIKVNEQVNDNGSNPDTFFGRVDPLFQVTTDPNLTQGKTLPGQTNKLVSTAAVGPGNSLQTTIKLIRDNGGSGNVVYVQDLSTTSGPGPVCADCQSTDYVEVHVNGGAAISPYLVWTLTGVVSTSFDLNKAVVAHFKDDKSLDFVLTNKQKSLCKNSTSTNCLESLFTLAPIPGDTTHMLFTATFRSGFNGYGRY